MLIALAVSTPLPARAVAERVNWPMFFRSGPGPAFSVIQELPRGTEVEVLACGGQWCRVQVGRVIGYVEQDNLGTLAQRSTSGSSPSAERCFESRQAGYGKGEEFRYCPR